jgi:hypothetical protein
MNDAYLPTTTDSGSSGIRQFSRTEFLRFVGGSSFFAFTASTIGCDFSREAEPLSRPSPNANEIVGGPSPTPRPEQRALAASSNERVSHDNYLSHAEVGLAANPRDLSNLVAACIATEGSQPPMDAITTYCSFDGGASWQSNGSLPDSARGRDPTVACSRPETPSSAPAPAGVSVWRSIDGGKAFESPVSLSGAERIDHPALACGQVGGDGRCSTPCGPRVRTTWTGRAAAA